MTRIRSVEQADFAFLADWWRAHGWPVLEHEKMPKHGLVVTDTSDNPICAGWFYESDTWLAWMEYLVKNPDAPREVADAALDLLVTELAKLAKSRGFGILLSCTDKASLKARYERLGFQKADENVTHYVRRL